MPRHPTIFLVLTAWAVLTGCGQLDAMRGIRTKRDDTSRSAEGDLARYVATLRAQKNQSACDDRLRGKVDELAAALDARKSELDAFAAKLPPSEKFNRVSLGPITVREPKQANAVVDEWTVTSTGWDDIYASYQKIRSGPINAQWISLNAAVRAILVNDKNRLVYRENMNLKREDYPTLALVKKSIDACLADEACETPAYDEASVALIEKIPAYRILAEPNRASLASLQKEVGTDLREKMMERNKSLKLAADGGISVALDPGPFGDVLPQLEGYITSVWTSEKNRLKIDWVSQGERPEAYRILVEPGFGGRSFVRYSDKTVHLYSDVRSRSIAHEIGHVLGFPDYYYTSFDDATCVYETAGNDADLMSASAGSVTADEWAELTKGLSAPSSI